MFTVMADYSKNLSEHKFYWCSKLYLLMRHLAKLKSNVVLKILADVEQLQLECRYPENGLLFAKNKWRVFYHCHDAASKHPHEHGHFHLFTDIGNQEWAHVAGLSIDDEGQPLHWFMSNRWVTDGPWLSRKNFMQQIKSLELCPEDDLVGNWLTVMLHLYSDTLFEMINNRDAKIEQKLNGRSKKETLEDRDIYTVATKDIDLQTMLEKYLIRSHAEIA